MLHYLSATHVSVIVYVNAKTRNRQKKFPAVLKHTYLHISPVLNWRSHL